MNRILLLMALIFFLWHPVTSSAQVPEDILSPGPTASMASATTRYDTAFPPGLAPAAGFLAKPAPGHVPVDMGPTASPVSAAACGTNIYYRKCEHCFILVGPKTEEQCQEVGGLIEHNREVLERALCRLSEYEGWKSGADQKSLEALLDLLQEVKENIPGMTNSVNLSTLAGKATFAGRVVSMLKIQMSLVEFLGNSQGSSVFTGMMRPVKREISTVSEELRKELLWYERNCPPVEEDQPLDPLPPDYLDDLPADSPGEKPSETPVSPPGGTIGLEEFEDELLDRNALRWQLDFSKDLLRVEDWTTVLSDLQPLGIVGFVRALNRGAWVGRLHPVNLLHARQALDAAFADSPRGLEAQFLEPDFFAPIHDTSVEGWGPKDPLLANERIGGAAHGEVPEHGLVRLMPGSQVRGDVRYDASAQEAWETDDGEHRVDGSRWYGDFDIVDANGRADALINPMHVLAEYDMEAERLGGEVTKRTQNRLEFRIPGAPGRGMTWVKVWASDARYTLTVVDESSR